MRAEDFCFAQCACGETCLGPIEHGGPCSCRSCKKTEISILGVDPGMANMGYGVVQVASWGEKLVDLGVIRTEKSDKKRKVLASDDNVRRCRAVVGVLRGVFSRHQIKVLAVEAMSFPRSSSAAAKMAMTWGVLVALAEENSVPIVQASPQEIKKALCGRKDASKEDVEAAVKRRYGDQTVDQYLDKLANSYREHAYDALAAIVTSFDSEIVRMLRKVAA